MNYDCPPPTCVILDGPYSAGIDRCGDEYPEWTVSVENDHFEVERTFTFGSYESALCNARRIAASRRLELVLDGSPEAPRPGLRPR